MDASAYGATNRTWLGMRINPAVFFPTVVLSLAVILYSLFAPEASARLFDGMREGVVKHFAGFLMTTGNVLLLVCLALIVSPLGNIRLGGKDATPDYSRLSWFSMLCWRACLTFHKFDGWRQRCSPAWGGGQCGPVTTDGHGGDDL
jgi:betaine/carnitine transporter, BCCT family